MPEPIDLNEGRTRRRPPKGESAPKAERAEAAPPAPKRRTPNDKKLIESVTGTYQAIGLALIGIGSRQGDQGLAKTGLATVESAEPIADAWMDLADKNPAVKKALQRMTEVTAVGVLVGLHVTLALPLLADRGVLPEMFATMAGAATQNGNGPGEPNPN